MSTEFIELGVDEFEKKTALLTEDFAKIEKKLREEISKEVLEEAAQVFLNEQKAIISQKYPQYVKWLTVWTKKSKNGYRLYVGYTNVKDHLEVMITEFGRPGARGGKKGGKDSLKRKIGKVEPFPHIRASKILKQDEFNEKLAQLLEKRLAEEWNKRTG